MANWVIYNPANGQILLRLGGSEPTEGELGSNDYLEVEEGEGNANFFYVDIEAEPPELAARPAFSLTESATEFLTTGSFTVSGVPVGATLYHPDGETVINDGDFEWESTLPGEFYLRLSLFPYLDKEWTLAVNNPSA